MQKKGVTIGLLQLRPRKEREDSLALALAKIGEAAKGGAQIVCLPELFLGPYFCERPDDADAFRTAENIPGPATKALSDAAKKHGIVLIGGSIFEKAGDKYFNTSPVFNEQGELLGSYRKTHIPEDPLYHEQHYFSPGDTGIKVFDTSFGRIAVLICYDQWFPEAARIAALKGAEIIFYPTAIGDFVNEKPEEGNWQEAWEAVQRGHAIANNVFVATANRVGREEGLSFFGGSFIYNEFGTLLAHAGNDEEILLAECDLSRIGATREGWGFFRNRRPGEYGTLSSPKKS